MGRVICSNCGRAFHGATECEPLACLNGARVAPRGENKPVEIPDATPATKEVRLTNADLRHLLLLVLSRSPDHEALVRKLATVLHVETHVTGPGAGPGQK